MTNGFDMKVEGDKLTIVIDLAQKGTLSSTGKTMLVATSHGAQPVNCKRAGVKVSFNVTAPTH